ncbi:unnamed protein product [Amaranthus hypochondriacus]
MLDKGRKRLKDNDDVFEAFKSTDEDGFVDLYVVGGNPGKWTTSNTTNVVEPNVGKRRKPLTSPLLDSFRRPQKLQPDVETPKPSSQKPPKPPSRKQKLPVKRKASQASNSATPRKRPTPPPQPLPPPPPPPPPAPPPPPVKKVTPRKKYSARRGPAPRKNISVPQPQQQPPSQTPTEPQPQPEAAPPPPSQTPPQPQHAQLDPVVEQTQVYPPIQPTQVDPPVSERRTTNNKGKGKVIHKRSKTGAKRALFIDEDDLDYEEQP